MASDECCKKGHLATGEPTGTFQQLEGLEVYVSTPPHPSDKAVLFITDAFGVKLLNSQLLADAYAQGANVTVYIPDFLGENAVPLDTLKNPELMAKYDFTPFRIANSREKKADIIQNFAKALKEKHGVKKLATIGFCWGGMGSFILGGTDLVDATAVAHPSLFTIQDIENLKHPALFLCAEKDNQLTPELRQQAEVIMEKKKPLYSLFKFYPGTVHGFAVRGDSSDSVIAAAAADAKDQAIAFFNHVL